MRDLGSSEKSWWVDVVETWGFRAARHRYPSTDRNLTRH